MNLAVRDLGVWDVAFVHKSAGSAPNLRFSNGGGLVTEGGCYITLAMRGLGVERLGRRQFI